MHTLDMIPQVGFVLELGVTSGAYVLEPKMISFHIQIEVMFSLSGVLEIGQLSLTPLWIDLIWMFR